MQGMGNISGRLYVMTTVQVYLIFTPGLQRIIQQTDFNSGYSGYSFPYRDACPSWSLVPFDPQNVSALSSWGVCRVTGCERVYVPA